MDGVTIIGNSNKAISVDTSRVSTKHYVDSLVNTVSGGIDTTSLSNRIDEKLNISDTASMLVPYLRIAEADSTNIIDLHSEAYYDTQYYPLSSNPAGYLTSVGTLDSTTITGFHTSDYYNTIFTPLTRSLTINGSTQNLSANRTWNVGTVTSIGTISPITGGTITSTGTIGIDTTIVHSFNYNEARYYPITGNPDGFLTSANNLSDVGSASTSRSNLGLGNVENTALSTWAGSTNLTTLGTIATGVWNGSTIGNSYLTNSTISGVSLGSNLSTLSIASELISGGASSYNGSSAKSIAIQNTSVTNSMLAGSIASSKLVGTDIATVGTITSGIWNGTAIGDSYISSASTWNAKANSGANTDITSLALNQTGLKVKGGDANKLVFKPNETMTAERTLNLKVNDADRTIDLSGNLTVPSSATVSGTNTGDQDLSSYLTSATAASTYAPLTRSLTINGTARDLSSDRTWTISTITGNAGTATGLQTARSIYGGSFDGTADLTGIIASTYGGTGNGFTKFSGAASTEKTYTLPNSNATLLYSGGALGTPSSGTLTNCTFPTLNQNTTGSAASLTTARTIGGTSFDGTADITVATATGGFTVSGGSLSLADATTPALTLASGKTNTGTITINGKTSGSLIITAADATAQAITLKTASQTVGAATLTIPDMANTNKTIAWLESPSFTTPALGTPASGTLTNCTSIPAAQLSGTTIASGVVTSSLTKTGNARVNRTVNTGTANVTMTGADIVAGVIYELTGTTGRTFTFDTGTNISTAAGGSTTGDTFTFYIKCSGTSTGTITLAGNTGTTLQSSAVIAIGTMRTCLVRCTGSNTWTVY